jgi:DNA-binding NtrC family response regulator
MEAGEAVMIRGVPKRCHAGDSAIERIPVLAVIPDPVERTRLSCLFSGWAWDFQTAANLRQASGALRTNQVAVVLAEFAFPGGGWKDLLQECRRAARPPRLIVTGFAMSDAAWEEVLVLGANDALAKPYEDGEVLRAVELAWLDWELERRPQRGRAPH